MLLDGIHVPLTTPFYPDGRLNLRKLEHNVDRYSRTPAAGIIVLSSIGEATSLGDAETREALAAAVDVAAAEKVMLAGVSRDSVFGALEIVDTAAGLGYDGVVIGLPATLVGRVRETLTYFQAIADRVALPLVLASSGGRELGLEVIAEVAQHPRVIGIVDAGGRVAEIRAATVGVKHEATVTTVFTAVTGRMVAKAAAPILSAATFVGVESLQGGTGLAVAAAVSGPALKTRMRETGFQVLSGGTLGILEGLRVGAVGAVPRMAACAPQACYEVLAGWKDGDQGLAEEKQQRLVLAAEYVESLGVPGLKYACDLNGYFGGRPRLPFAMISGAEKAEIDRLMAGMRN